MHWCRSIDYNGESFAVDIITFDPYESYSPEFAKMFMECPDEVVEAWRYDRETGKWLPPKTYPRQDGVVEKTSGVGQILNFRLVDGF